MVLQSMGWDAMFDDEEWSDEEEEEEEVGIAIMGVTGRGRTVFPTFAEMKLRAPKAAKSAVLGKDVSFISSVLNYRIIFYIILICLSSICF